MSFADYEVKAIRATVGDRLDSTALDKVLAAPNVEVEHTGVGYFATAAHDSLPADRQVFSEVKVVGKFGSDDLGFVVFVENHELVLECFSYGESLPNAVREQNVEIVAT